MTEDLRAEVESLKVNVHQLQARLRVVEDRFDTRNTPTLKRVLFRLDGWPDWTRVVDRPAWRPWRRWFRS